MAVKHFSDEDAVKEFGFTPRELAELSKRAQVYDSGKWPDGASVIRPHGGRPAVLQGEETKTVSIRVNESRLEAMDDEADRRGLTRSGAFREAIDVWLATRAC